MIRLGIMGCGAVADFGHAPAIVENPGFQLAAVYDPVEERASAFASKFGVPVAAANTRDFFAAGLQAVVIASPPAAHYDNAVSAADHGCHVLCEKPLSIDEANSRRLATEVASRGVRLYTAFVYRFTPVAQQIREWVRAGTAGEIRSLRLIYDWDLHGQWERSPEGAWVESPRWRGRMVEGGPLVDCGVHQIDLARWWLGSEVESFDSIGAWVSDHEAPDHVFLHMLHANSAVSTIETSFTFCHTAREPISLFSYHLIGTGGLLRYEREGYILEARTGSQTIQLPGSSEKDFPGMIEAFRRAIETGERGDLATAEDGIIATAIATRATAQATAARNHRH